ncbi:MAG: glycine--tRNA ligase subunit beta [Alphaproteobacteria bacterium]|nr:glycine--tRNA ligase subunit beta [Alphaproteobacteria bacterium]
MSNFLVELLIEEIPARFQLTAIKNFSDIIVNEFEKNKICYENIKSYVTPRRLVFSAKLHDTIAEFSEEKKGPQISAPSEVIEKFLKSIGISREACVERIVNNKTFIFANIKHEKRNVADSLGEIVKTAILSLPWPKSMHWGEHSFSFVRPLRNIMCVFNGKVIDVDMRAEINLRSVDYTFGHRFMANRKVFAKDINEYLKNMKDAFVIADQNERRQIILDKCADINEEIEKSKTNSEKINVLITEDLLEEVVGLVEYPVVITGKISEKFMRLPEEVIITTMRTHQRYFPTMIGRKLAPYFVFVANNITDDNGKAIRAGNERVLSARLADALFFFENDLTIPLERHLDDLKKIAFNEKLGTIYDRTLRIVDVCGYLYNEVSRENTCGQLMLSKNSGEILKRAALLAKCDLATNLVCEFTELQGIMGAHYARCQGESEEVCYIIRDQYKPIDELYSPLCALYSMADKIDVIVGLFAIGKMPTGSKDPFALRRAAIGIIKIIMKYEMNIDLYSVLQKTFERLKQDTKTADLDPCTVGNVMAFILDRLRVVLKDSGIDHDVINAVLAVPQDIQSMQKKAKILDSILKSELGKQIISIYKRARNIVNGNSGTFVDDTLFSQEEEKKFFAEIKKLEEDFRKLKNDNLCVIDEFELKLTRCLQMENTISEFFTNVLVNTDDATIKVNRIGLLAKFLSVINNELPEISRF